MTGVKVLIIDLKGQKLAVSEEGAVTGGRGQPLVQRLSPDGYPEVTAGRHGRGRVKVHNLVAMAFLGGRPEGFQVNHIDGNKENNKASNLEYVSQKENLRHAFVTGLRDGNMPAKSVQAVNDEGFGYWFFSQSEAGRYGFTQANVSQCVRGVRPTCKGFKWSVV